MPVLLSCSFAAQKRCVNVPSVLTVMVHNIAYLTEPRLPFVHFWCVISSMHGRVIQQERLLRCMSRRMGYMHACHLHRAAYGTVNITAT